MNKVSEASPASEMSDVERPVRLPFPKGCTIKNIRVGTGSRSNNVYASLYSPDGDLLISATLEYINDRLLEMGTAT